MALGIWLVFMGVQMSRATYVTKEDRPIAGTKGRNAALGAAGGAVLGGGTAATVGGGIGVALMGTGVGIPFGALILLGVGLGAGAGGLAGAASGKSATTVVIVSNPLPLYSPWYWGAIIIAGILLMMFSVSYMRKLHDQFVTPQ
ncbi:MAG: hypothetical protein FJ395_10095 [Verrucomicrobia bacterium]|nr:hypothetical protein [Verrucomicrobiota bacterium]